jgi:ABC-type uncharacterized transport system auxiliary subunit
MSKLGYKNSVLLRTLFVAPLLLLSSACSPIFGGERPAEVEYLVVPTDAEISERNTVADRPATPGHVALLIADVRASSQLSGTKILFTEDGSTVGSYQLARWNEPFTARLQLELVRELESRGAFSSVTRLATLIAGRRLLNLELLEAIHDAREAPGTVRLAVRAEMLDLTDGRIIASTEIRRAYPAQEHSSSGAVAAYRKGLSELVQLLADWAIERGAN